MLVFHKNKSLQKETKTKPLLRLIMKYYYKGFFTPFFLVLYPILILFIQGFAFKDQPLIAKGLPTGKFMIDTVIPGITIVQLISIGLFTIPMTIVEFKNSIVFKRIGATNIRPIIFVGTIIGIGMIMAVFSVLWTLLWAGIMFGSSNGWQIAFPRSIGKSIPFLLLALAMAISLGMMLAALVKTETALIAISNLVFLPVAFLSGSFIPFAVIESSSVLKGISWAIPFRYSVWPFMEIWQDNIIKINVLFWVNLIVSLSFISLFIGVASWKLKWQE